MIRNKFGYQHGIENLILSNINSKEDISILIRYNQNIIYKISYKMCSKRGWSSRVHHF
jgi:hypothetical protein